MPTYAVTGASGHFGGLAVLELLARGIPATDVVALARTPARAAGLAAHGVEVREADYARVDTLPTALDGVRRLLLVSGSEPGDRIALHSAVIDAARAAGVERIAYTSILKADTSSNPLAAEHLGTEQALRRSGIPFSLLRNSWYIENYTAQLPRYLARGAILGATGAGRISGAARSDYAAAAVTALISDEAPDTVHELGGPAFSLADLADAVTSVTGTTVVYRDLPVPEFAAALQEVGLDAGTAGFVAALDASIAAGELETESEDLTRLLGREPIALVDAVRAAV